MEQNNKFENRFLFISDTSLRKNLGDALAFVDHLVSLSLDKNQEKIIINALNKTIVIHTASIVEAVVHFFVQEKSKNQSFYDKNWTYTDIKLLHKIEGDEEIIAGKRKKKKLKIKRNTDFKTLNEICLREKFFTKRKFEKIEKLRKERNTIHLAGLSGNQGIYSQKQINEFFNTSSEILEIIEEKIVL